MTDYPNTEAILLRWNQSSKSGATVVFEVDEAFITQIKGYEGQRFQIVAVPVGNDEKPIKVEPKKAVSPEVEWLVMRCKEAEFWAFLEKCKNESEAKDRLLWLYGVGSRKDIPAQEIKKIMRDYKAWTTNAKQE